MAEKEIWKVYPDYSFVEVSSLGRVRTKDRYVKVKGRGKRLVKGRVLKQWSNDHGYMLVNFNVNGKSVKLQIHRMVAITFIPNPDNLPEVNHKDNNPKNNAVSNLEWCTCQYNQDYKRKFGTSQAELFGKPVIAINQETSEAFWFESQLDTARQLGINVGRVNNVIKGQRNKTHGFCFCNADSTAVEKTRSKFGDEIADKVEKLILDRQ